MNFRLSLFYGMRNLFGRKRPEGKNKHRMIIPVLSIALSLIPVIVILEVANGMIEGITLRFIEFDTGHLNLRLYDEQEIPFFREKITELENTRSVTTAYLERQGGGLLFFNNQRYFVTIRAVPADLWKRDPGFRAYTELAAGEFNLERSHSIVIGRALAEEYGIRVGDVVILFTHKTEIRGGEQLFHARPNRLRVTGIYSIGYQELDKNIVFISFDDGINALAGENSFTSLVMKVSDPFTDIDGQAASVERMIEPDMIFWRVNTWQDLNGNYYNAFQSTKMILVFIMLLIVLVAAFNISSSMIMVVLDRLQEIGILKSIGAPSGTISLSFMWGGLIAGLISTVIGVSIGLLIAVNINEIFLFIEDFLTILNRLFAAALGPFVGETVPERVRILNPEYYLEVIPIRINPWEVIGVSLLAVILSVFFSFFPSRMAEKIRPLEVIRKY